MSAENQLVRYQFGEWLFEPHLNQLRRGDEVCPLEYRGAEVLQYLLDHPGQIVSINDLLDAVWADRVVESNVIHRNLSLIRQALGDDPRHPRYIETISKRGYRTIAAVEAQFEGRAEAPETQESLANPPPPRSRWALVIAAGFAVTTLVVGLLLPEKKPQLAQGLASLPQASSIAALTAPQSNSVAVLPFENLSPKADDAYFAAGVHQEIIDRLVTSSDLLVIARGSVIAYVQHNKSIQQIATELGVAAVLTGSVRFEKNRVRLAIQLIDGQSALHLWSQTFERDLTDVFEIQDEISANIAQQLNATLIEGKTTSERRNPQAHLLQLQARHLLGLGGIGRKRLQRAEALLEQARKIDPNDTGVMLELARLYLQQEQASVVPAHSTAKVRRDLIERVLALEPKNGVAHAWLGWHAMFTLEDMAMAARHYQLAMALAPNNANVTRGLASLLLHVGKLPEARAVAEVTVTLDPLCAVCLHNLAASQLQLADYDRSIASAKGALSLQPTQASASITLGVAQMLSGDPTSALTTFAAMEIPYYRTALLAMAQSDLGLEDEFAESRELLLTRWPQASLLIGTMYAYTDDHERAFIYLTTAANEGLNQQRVGFHGGPNDPLLAKLKRDPRWVTFLELSEQAPDDFAKFDFELNLPNQNTTPSY